MSVPWFIPPQQTGLSALADGFGQGFTQGRERLQERQGVETFGRYLDSMGAKSSLGALGQGSALPAPSGAVSAAPTASARVPLSVPQGERAGYIRQGLIQRGLPEHVADAFVLNFQDESGLNPDINEAKPLVPGSRGGYGLYQLTGPRRRMYEAFARDRGVDTSDIDAQLDFLKFELGGPEAKAAQSIMGSRDTATAAQAIVNNFLRPAPEHRQSRSARYASYTGSAPAAAPSATDETSGGTLAPPARQAMSPLPTFTPPAEAQQAFPDREIMLDLFRNPNTRPLAIEMARNFQTGTAPRETWSTIEREDGSIFQLNNLTGEYKRVVEGQGAPSYGFQNVGGTLVRTDPTSGSAMPVFQQEPEPGYALIPPEEARQLGLPPGVPFQRSPQGQISQIGGGGTTVNVGDQSGGSGAFYQNLDKANAEMFGTLLSSAPNAQTNLARVDRLEGMLGELGSGWQNNATLIAGNLGIDLGNASGVQAAQALINSMVPEQRAPGSGPMSDADLELFKQSLPRIINSPEGNRRIIETLRGISQYQLSQADIAGQVASRQITPEQGNEMLRTLPNPVAWLREAELPAPISAPLTEGGNIPTITSSEAYQALPSGAQYRAPDGSIRTKQ